MASLRLHRMLKIATLAAACLTLSLPVLADAAASAAPLARIKQIQVQRMMAEPMQERREWRERRIELAKLARALKKSGKHAVTQKGLHAKPEFRDDEPVQLHARAVPQALRMAAPDAVNAPPIANKRVNNPTGDQASDGQCETSIVAFGNNMLAAWNDGTGFSDGTNDSQGWATSTDAGATWTDQGHLPKPASFPSLVWTSDPVLAVNTTTGAFYYSGLCDPLNNGAQSGIGVLKGRFNGASFAWDVSATPTNVLRTVNASTDFLDKQWIAVNPANGKVFVSYTWFPPGSSEIDIQAADSSLTSWTSQVKVSLAGEDGRVQGSRPAVAPDGSVYVMYYLIGTVDLDFMRIAKSTNQAVSFGTPVTACSFYTNYGSGAPGFNRTTGIQFGSIAIDRTGGTHNGRIFITWPESMNWYDDEAAMVSTGNLGENDPGGTGNNTAATANAFTAGKTLEGTCATTSDLDYYSIAMTAGQTLLVEPDSLATGLTLFVRMYATNGTSRLALTSADNTTGSTNPGVFIFTAPVAGTYYVRAGSAGGTGKYRIRTALAARTTERGRDQRDVFMTYSDNGSTWSNPVVRISSSATGYDDWLPEIAVAADPSNSGHGDRVYALWYDFRDATAATNGAESSNYLARSDDGGATWNELGPTSDALSPWTTVSSNIQPNQGDYQALWADANQVLACWGDGRDGNPNVYMSRWTLQQTPTALALVSADATTDHIALTWYSAAGASVIATAYRSTDGQTWQSLGELTPDSEGLLHLVDTNVTPGETYQYRIGLLQNGSERFYGLASVAVPARLAFALAGARPNPSAGAPTVAFSLANDEPATLSLIDISGRVVESRAVGSLGAGAHVVSFRSDARLRPGVYLVRLEQRGTALTSRVSIVR